MPRNFELKARIPSLETAREDALRCGARFVATVRQTDTYFVVPYGRLKLRQVDGEGSELIYYNREELRDERWSQYTTIPVAEPIATRDVLAASLGTRVVVRKSREVFLHRMTRIHLDLVDGLGSFLEFEVQDAGELESIREMELLRREFRIGPGSVVRSSYADLLGEVPIR